MYRGVVYNLYIPLGEWESNSIFDMNKKACPTNIQLPTWCNLFWNSHTQITPYGMTLLCSRFLTPGVAFSVTTVWVWNITCIFHSQEWMTWFWKTRLISWFHCKWKTSIPQMPFSSYSLSVEYASYIPQPYILPKSQHLYFVSVPVLSESPC